MELHERLTYPGRQGFRTESILSHSHLPATTHRCIEGTMNYISGESTMILNGIKPRPNSAHVAGEIPLSY
jgi:hypothetical protein